MVVRRYRGTEMVVAVVHARNSFGMHCYEKRPRKSFRMRSYKIIGLKVPWNHTLPKRRGRGVVRQRSASLPLLRVAAEEPVPADGEHFAKHAQAVAEDVNLGLWVVRPTHRNFDGAQAMAFGEEKDFGVEAEALDALLLKDDARVFADKGFKAFVREHARIIFEQQRIERFGFDPEILFLAKRHGLRAIEIPVRWAHDPQTKVNMIRDSLRMFGEVLAIRWNWLLGRYPKKRQ